MDLKCLIKLLIEKEYVTEYKKLGENKTCVIEYDCKYKEVREKIQDCIENYYQAGNYLDIEYRSIDRGKKTHIQIINKKLLKEYILHTSNSESFCFYDHHVDYMDIQLSKIFEHDSDLDVKYNTRGYYEITNNIKKNKRLSKEQVEKNECLDFLSKLP